MPKQLNVGDQIPAFSLKDQEGIDIESEDLIGSPFVLYFYPKDDTPGCTIEACSFRDNMDKLDELDTLVIGISPDTMSSHTKFINKHDLNFTLLSDEKMDVAIKFGSVQEKEVDGKKSLSILRSTFLIDSSGKICWLERPVAVDGHADRVIEAVHENTR